MPTRLTLFVVMACVLLTQAVSLPAKGAISHRFDGLQALLTVCYNVTVNPQLIAAIYYLVSLEKYTLLFTFLFFFRYIRLMVNIVGVWIYSPTPIPSDPTMTSKDTTVIVPTVNPFNPDFAECISSIVATEPASIVIVTAGGYQNFEQASSYSNLLPQSRILVLSCPIISKRRQITLGLSHATTAITILCDDHVFWPPTLMPHLLAPFHNLRIGAVCTNKCVRRTSRPGALTWASYWNLIGVLYLERCSFDTCATNTIDGGVFVLSGRTVGYRTSILRDPACIASFLGEYTGTGRSKVGPLNVDDDNFYTRWIVSHGWKIKVQAPAGGEAKIETTLGEWPNYLKQCLRWSRTTWRSNPKALFIERSVFGVHPWSTYAIYIAQFFNFALFYDLALLSTLHLSLLSSIYSKAWLFALSLWILASKLVKVAPYFAAHPKDIVLLPGYIIFGWFHSLIKLYALFTMWDISWGGRQGLGDGDVVGAGKVAVDVDCLMGNGMSGKAIGIRDGPSDKSTNHDRTSDDLAKANGHSTQGLNRPS